MCNVVSSRFRFYMTASLFVLLMLNGFSAKAQSSPYSLCQPLPTEFNFLETRWHWLNQDQVVFKVNNGEDGNGIFEKHSAWYSYRPSDDTLQKLDASPFQSSNLSQDQLKSLIDLQAGENGMYELVSISPSGKRFVYARAGQQQLDYWFTDSESGLQIDLNTSSPTHLPLETLWSADEAKFILQGIGFPNSVEPIQFITIQNQTATVQRLSDIVPLSDYGASFRENGFTVMGIDATLRYIVIQPETTDYFVWLLDVENGDMATLNFRSRGDEHIVWTDEETFVAVTDLGVIRYQLDTQKTDILVHSDEIGLDSLNYGNLSPDGRFVMGVRSDSKGGRNQHIEVCQVG